MKETLEVNNFELQLDQSAKQSLADASKWAHFLAIVGFIGIGITLAISFILGVTLFAMSDDRIIRTIAGEFYGIFTCFCYFVIAALYYFPVLALYKFSKNTKKALEDSDSGALVTSFRYLKSHFKYIGILMLSIMILYGFLILAFLIMISSR